ncbi:MAG: molecular chaperone DnaJ [Deltaproteobacteria bacterium]|jgi:molecular chaperone DnaJ|nr:molecular chaperone DnaJ [Deltaproteobacteria bacterium]
MNLRCYYEVLEVSREASEDEIKRAYRKLAMQHHPDRNPDDPGAERKFKEAAEAYDILRDPERRARYDRFGHAGVQQGAGMGGFSSAEDIFVHFSDIFGDLFGFAGARGGGPRPTPGPDLRYNLKVSFKQAATGAEIPLKLPRRVTCDECGGSGAAPGTKPETCRQCGGSGQIRRSQGFFQIAVSCPVCRGEGKIIVTPCPRCRGEGVLPQMRELTVRVPAGVDTGTRLRLRGEGENGMYGGPPGDLYVVLAVEEDRTFRRQGQDLIHSCKISFPQAALGIRLEVPSLDGPVALDVPKGTQSGAVLRLKGRGMPYLGQSRNGDLLVEVIVQTPTRLSARQEELLRELDQLLRGEDGPLDKVKNAAKKIFKK